MCKVLCLFIIPVCLFSKKLSQNCRVFEKTSSLKTLWWRVVWELLISSITLLWYVPYTPWEAALWNPCPCVALVLFICKIDTGVITAWCTHTHTSTVCVNPMSLFKAPDMSNSNASWLFFPTKLLCLTQAVTTCYFQKRPIKWDNYSYPVQLIIFWQMFAEIMVLGGTQSSGQTV